MIRYMIIFQGQVQSVGFRVFCHSLALKYQLTGKIRNLANGNVELFIQGEEDNITAFLKEVIKGNLFIKISDYRMKKVQLIIDEKGFTIHG